MTLIGNTNSRPNWSSASLDQPMPNLRGIGVGQSSQCRCGCRRRSKTRRHPVQLHGSSHSMCCHLIILIQVLRSKAVSEWVSTTGGRPSYTLQKSIRYTIPTYCDLLLCWRWICRQEVRVFKTRSAVKIAERSRRWNFQPAILSSNLLPNQKAPYEIIRPIQLICEAHYPLPLSSPDVILPI